MSSIIFSTIFYSNDKRRYNNEKVLKTLIDELNFLGEKGISFIVGGLQKCVKFQLVLILGDNLGLNSITGFVECFKAKFCCRICKISSEGFLKYTNENDSTLRDKKNYAQDVETANEFITGVKELCVFNTVLGFHISEKISVDIMHDVLEGICQYALKSILHTFIFTKKRFTLDELNNRIKMFCFYPENLNRSPLIKLKTGKNKLNLKFSAAKTL